MSVRIIHGRALRRTKYGNPRREISRRLRCDVQYLDPIYRLSKRDLSPQFTEILLIIELTGKCHSDTL